MNRDRCLQLYKRAIGLETPSLAYEEINEVIVSYVCDTGHEEYKDYVPLMLSQYFLYIQDFLTYAFDYYKRLYNFIVLEKLLDPNDLNRRIIIQIY